MYRLKVSEALKSAVDMGSSQLTAARKVLTDLLAELTTTSVSFASGHRIALQLRADLQNAIDSMRDQQTYEYQGGKANIYESYTSNSHQR